MNKLTIIGNLTKDPELRTTQNGHNVCSFTVAVNRRTRGADGRPESDFFHVNAWRQLGENCAKYLSKGKKVCVIGAVGVHTYQGQDGNTFASLDVTADDIEFLSPRGDGESAAPAAAPAVPAAPAGMIAVETDDLPF